MLWDCQFELQQSCQYSASLYKHVEAQKVINGNLMIAKEQFKSDNSSGFLALTFIKNWLDFETNFEWFWVTLKARFAHQPAVKQHLIITEISNRRRIDRLVWQEFEDNTKSPFKVHNILLQTMADALNRNIKNETSTFQQN